MPQTTESGQLGQIAQVIESRGWMSVLIGSETVDLRPRIAKGERFYREKQSNIHRAVDDEAIFAAGVSLTLSSRTSALLSAMHSCEKTRWGISQHLFLQVKCTL